MGGTTDTQEAVASSETWRTWRKRKPPHQEVKKSPPRPPHEDWKGKEDSKSGETSKNQQHDEQGERGKLVISMQH